MPSNGVVNTYPDGGKSDYTPVQAELDGVNESDIENARELLQHFDGHLKSMAEDLIDDLIREYGKASRHMPESAALELPFELFRDVGERVSQHVTNRLQNYRTINGLAYDFWNERINAEREARRQEEAAGEAESS